jgi:hypothetical protein
LLHRICAKVSIFRLSSAKPMFLPLPLLESDRDPIENDPLTLNLQQVIARPGILL